LTQILEELVQAKKAKISDNRRVPNEYQYFWKKRGYKTKFYFTSQSHTPVFTEIQMIPKKSK